jgi:hypothetical protein
VKCAFRVGSKNPTQGSKLVLCFLRPATQGLGLVLRFFDNC